MQNGTREGGLRKADNALKRSETMAAVGYFFGGPPPDFLE